MPVFQYSGTNAEGKLERGLLHGESLETVAKQLADKGVRVEQLGVAQSQGPSGQSAEQAAPSYVAEVMGTGFTPVPLSTIRFFFQQLGTMLNAGISGAEALNSLANNERNLILKGILAEARDFAASGRPISEALERHPKVFTPLMVAMVRAGERGGFLSDQCSNMADYLAREIELRNLIRKETAYPKIVVASSIVLIVFANSVISVYGHEGAQKIWSPLTTPANWIVLGPVVLILLYYFKVVNKQPAAKFKWDQFVLKVPYIGPTSHGFSMAKFGRSFGALYKAGVPVHEAIQLAGDACGNEYVRWQVYPAANALKEGEGITSAFARTGAFTPLVLDMVRTGETTGDIDFMLNKVSEHYEEEGAVRARQAAIVIGVIVFIAVAIYVFIVLLKFYSGYFGGIMGAGGE